MACCFPLARVSQRTPGITLHEQDCLISVGNLAKPSHRGPGADAWLVEDAICTGVSVICLHKTSAFCSTLPHRAAGFTLPSHALQQQVLPRLPPSQPRPVPLSSTAFLKLLLFFANIWSLLKKDWSMDSAHKVALTEQ